MGNHKTGMAAVSGTDRDAACDTMDVAAQVACTNTALRRASRRLGQLYDDELAPLGLKATQLGLIAEIHKLSESDPLGPTLQDLAAGLAIQISALTHALRPLVRDGLVALEADSHDRRTKHGVLTPLGKERLAQAAICWARVNQQVERVLGTASAASLRSLADEVASDAFLTAYRGGKPVSERSD